MQLRNKISRARRAGVTVAEVDFDELSDGRVNGALDAIDRALVALEGATSQGVAVHGRQRNRFGRSPSGDCLATETCRERAGLPQLLSCLRKPVRLAT